MFPGKSPAVLVILLFLSSVLCSYAQTGWGAVSDDKNERKAPNISPRGNRPGFAQGWGTPAIDISPGKMMKNPWFKSSDFMPGPDEYIPPEKKSESSLRDTIENPDIVWIEKVRKDGFEFTGNFKAMQVDGLLYVPVIVLPHMFRTRVQWKAKEQRLFIFRGNESLVFSLAHGFEIEFFGDRIGMGARLILFRKMLFVPIKTLAGFFKKKHYWSRYRKILTLMPKTSNKDTFHATWRAVLKRNGLDTYAEKIINSADGPAVGSSQHPGRVFENIWATSEEPQRIASPGLHGDRYLKADDLACALPSRKALMKKIMVRLTGGGKAVSCTCVDVGPWNIDDPYWLKGRGRPRAESDRNNFYSRGFKKTNKAGIDLSFGLWHALGVPRSKAYGGNYSSYVDWWFAN